MMTSCLCGLGTALKLLKIEKHPSPSVVEMLSKEQSESANLPSPKRPSLFKFMRSKVLNVSQSPQTDIEHKVSQEIEQDLSENCLEHHLG